MQAKVGTVIVKDCLSRECVKQGRKGVWKESFSSTTCCSFQRRGFKVGEEIKSFTAADGCTQVSLFCSDLTGAPDVDVSVVSECTTGAATEESMMNSFEAVTDMLHLILNETGRYFTILCTSIQMQNQREMLLSTSFNAFSNNFFNAFSNAFSHTFSYPFSHTFSNIFPNTCSNTGSNYSSKLW